MTLDEQVAQKLGTEVKPYSTNLAAAWEIVEQPGLWVTVSRILNREFGLPDSAIYTTYHCEIYRNHSDNRSIGEADTAPLAIVRAFLKLPDADPRSGEK